MTPSSPPPPEPSFAVAPSDPPPSRPPRRIGRILVQSALGLAVGLGATEAAFRMRDGGAFPLVNVYARDELRGVRLAPGSATRVARPGGRGIEIRINQDGYRGAEWPAPSPGEVVIVGDSQSFGLGVEEHEALAARLHAALPGAPPVIDASVPTYGPPEYRITLEGIVARRTPAAIVLTVNLLNDLAEIDQPNSARHTAVDGWAARVDEGARPASSPMREAAIQRSHAAFALWRWRRMRDVAARPAPADGGLDALLLAGEAAAAGVRVEDLEKRAVDERAGELAAARAEAAAAQAAIVDIARRQQSFFGSSGPTRQEWEAFLRTEGEPVESEIFDVWYGGCSRFSGKLRVKFGAARIREDVEEEMRSLARSRVGPKGMPEETFAAFDRRDAARKRLAALERIAPPSPPRPRPPSPLAPFVAQMRAIAERSSARLVVVPVPIDAQIAKETAERRGLSADAIASIALVTRDLVEAARAAGAVAVDPTPDLARVGEGAYLPDGHLSPRGHEAIAKAVAAALGAQASL